MLSRFCKLFCPRSGSRLYGTLLALLKLRNFLKYLILKESQQTKTKAWKIYTGCKKIIQGVLIKDRDKKKIVTFMKGRSLFFQMKNHSR